MKKFLKLFFLFLMINVVSFSEIKIGVDNTNPEIEQHIILNVEFLEEEKAEYTIKGIEKFKIISMVSRSNYTSVNKKVNFSKSDVYILCPQKAGKTVISVKTNDGMVSNEIAVNILKESSGKHPEQKFILEIIPYDRDFYMGEKIPFAERVIIKSSVRNYNYVSTPVFNGFSIKNITPRDSRGFPIPKRVTSADGKEQVELVMFRSILEPVSVGKKSIKSGGISITEELSDTEEKTPVYLGFKEIDINILPLPEKDKPENFQGVVGILKGNCSWKEEIIDGKKAFVLKLKLCGNANLDKLERIISSKSSIREKYDIIENLILYDERVVDGVYSSQKEYEITFFPKNNSVTEIPFIEIPYFNPVEKKYKVFKITDNFSYKQEQTEKTSNFEHDKEVSYVPESEIKIDNFSNSSEERGVKPKVNKTTGKTEDKDTKNIIIGILSFLVIIEALYIFKLKRKIKNKKEAE